VSSNLSITTSTASTRITLHDSVGNPAGLAVGGFSSAVEAGLYTVTLETGRSSYQRFIAVPPTSSINEHIPAPLVCPTPLRDSTAETDDHVLDSVKTLSTSPSNKYGLGGSRVMVVVRPMDHAALAAFDSATIQTLTLKSASFWRSIDSYSSWQRAEKHMGMCFDVTPGSYVLRYATVDDIFDDAACDQVVVCIEGWTTMVFVPYGLATDGEGQPRPLPELASIHMVRLEDGFDPDGDWGSAAVAAECALQGLSIGRLLLPRDSSRETRELTRLNPMLGIYAAHASLRSISRPTRPLRELARDLRKLVPRHPDVVAISVLVKLRDNDSSRTRLPKAFDDQGSSRLLKAPPLQLSIPPMLALSYEALVERTAIEHELIPPFSIAEWAAANRRRDGVWTRWSGWDAHKEDQQPGKWGLLRLVRRIGRATVKVLRLSDGKQVQAQSSDQEVTIGGDDRADSLVADSSLTGAIGGGAINAGRDAAKAPATQQAVASDAGNEASPAGVALQFGLPYSAVDRAQRAQSKSHDASPGMP
jgi:hypothetical protein